MRDSASDKKIRLGEVAVALDIAPKLIRNWTASQDFDLLGDPDRQANKWRQYSYIDVAHLAIAAQAIRYGFSIADAHDFAGAALARLIKPMVRHGGTFAKVPGGAIEAICQGKNLYLFKLSGGDAVAFLTPLDDVPPYNACVHIDIALCVGMVFQGLKEVGHDAFSDSHAREYTEAEAKKLEENFAKFTAEHPELIKTEANAE